MAFSLSPSVDVREFDLTLTIPNLPSSKTGMVIRADWGEALTIKSITNERDLVNAFGEPTSYNYQDWYNAWNFLQYASSLYMVRAVDTTAENAGVEITGTGGWAVVEDLSEADMYNADKAELTLEQNVVPEGIQFYNRYVSSTQPFGVALADNATAFAAPFCSQNIRRIATEAVFDTSGDSGDSVIPITNATMVAGDTFVYDATTYTVDTITTTDATVSPELVDSSGNAVDTTVALSFETAIDLDQNAILSSNLVNADGSLATFGSFFEYQPDYAAGEFAVIVFALDEDGKYDTYLDEQYVLSKKETGRDNQGRNIFVDEYFFNKSNGLYSKFNVDTTHSLDTSLSPFVAIDGGSVAGVTHSATTDAAWDSTGDTTESTFDYTVNTLEVTDTFVHDGTTYTVSAVDTILDTVTVAPALVDSTGDPLDGVYVFTTGIQLDEGPAWLYPKTLLGTNWVADPLGYKLADVISAWDEFSDPEKFDVNILVTHELELEANAQDVAGVIAMSRKDCFNVVAPYDYASIVGKTPTEATAWMISEFAGTQWHTPGDLQFNTFSSYSALYANMKYQYDKFNDVNRWMCIGGDIAGLAAQTDANRDPWWAIAGLERGKIKNVIKPAFSPNKQNRDDLYVNALNPVMSIPGEGVMIVWGQKTALAKPSAFDRLNVRRLLITLEKAVATASRYALFEFNDEFTRARLRALIEPFLRDVKGRRGLYDFEVVIDESNNTAEVIDKNALVIDIYLKPTKVAEFIQVNMKVTRTDANFEELIGR